MFLIRSVRGVLALCSVLTAFGLLLGILAIWLNPDIWVIPAFFGLAYPLFFLANLALLITASIRLSKRWVIFHVFFLILGAAQFGHFINFSSPKSEQVEPKLKLISYNVRGFNRYKWLEQDSIQYKIEQFIIDEKPDVVCFQEFHLAGKDDIKSIRQFAKRIGLKYFVFNDFRASKDISGLVTFSKYPINTVYREHFHRNNFGGNGFMVCELAINDRPIRVVNMHLESIRFEQPDYEYAQDPTNERWEFKIAGVRLINRFVKAYRQRGEQAQTVAKHIEQANAPVILAGDANDTPVSFVYHTLTKVLDDSFYSGSFGTGATYAGRLPSFRIDYVFHSPALTALSHKIGKDKLSDHYPVICEFNWEN